MSNFYNIDDPENPVQVVRDATTGVLKLVSGIGTTYRKAYSEAKDVTKATWAKAKKTVKSTRSKMQTGLLAIGTPLVSEEEIAKRKAAYDRWKMYKGREVPLAARNGTVSTRLGIEAMKKAGFSDAEIEDWMVNYRGLSRAIDSTGITYRKTQKNPGTFGGGTYVGGGAGDHFVPPYLPKNTKNFNAAFDEARAAGADTFWFGDKIYNTIMEANPIREFNNRLVGSGRTEELIRERGTYGRDIGPIGGPYSLLPIIPYKKGGNIKINNKII